MSISYSIIDRHKGTITVESEEGMGTVFTIQLPVHEQAMKEERAVHTLRGKRQKGEDSDY